MKKESRESKRVKPDINIEIIDIITNSKLGNVLNISSSGLLIASSTIITPGEMFQTEWSFSSTDLKNIPVGIECLWVEAQYTNVCLCGFYIIDISKEGQHILDMIIARS